MPLDKGKTREEHKRDLEIAEDTLQDPNYHHQEDANIELTQPQVVRLHLHYHELSMLSPTCENKQITDKWDTWMKKYFQDNFKWLNGTFKEPSRTKKLPFGEHALHFEITGFADDTRKDDVQERVDKFQNEMDAAQLKPRGGWGKAFIVDLEPMTKTTEPPSWTRK
ncbi:MAG: hypothetical protein Q9162_007595 [Coniocarpon cinnabarinum]